MDKTINLSETLSGKLQTNVINEICRIANGDKVMKQNIYALAMGTDEHISYNALWVLSHFDSDSSEWLSMKQNDFIDLVITESHVGKRRILLSILNTQTFTKKSLRTDFIDFCMSKISSPIEQYAIRALCMKLAYKQCIFYPALLKELNTSLNMLPQQPLSPGLKSTRLNILRKIYVQTHVLDYDGFDVIVRPRSEYE